ncbi:MAG: hypothetical protein R2724_23570 [Bryobacterales bacterium]
MAVDPTNSNVLYLADRYGVLVSTDQGGTYTRATGLPQAWRVFTRSSAG